MLFLSLQIGWRYVIAKRRNQFISFISGFSLLGMTLGVISLIVVLSVMNGFDREIKLRILKVVPHGNLLRDDPMHDWRTVHDQAAQMPGVVKAFPYVSGHGLMAFQEHMQGVQFRGVELETLVEQGFEKSLLSGSLVEFERSNYGILLGRLLARYLNVTTGDQVTLILPQLTVTPAGVFPRMKRFTVVGVFEVGAEPDQQLALIRLQDGQKLLRLGEAVNGIELQTVDMYQAPLIVSKVARTIGHGIRGADWSQTQGSLFSAVKMEKNVITVLLLIIVAVAAFNIISSLVLMVADKRTDIAVLRTLGCRRGDVMAIFVCQGFIIGALGVVAGAISGSLIALNIGTLVQWLEAATGLYLFDPQVYFISELPSELRAGDVVMVVVVGLFLSFLSTLYPAWRASRIEPAEALRYE